MKFPKMNGYALACLLAKFSLLHLKFGESKMIDNIFTGGRHGVILYLSTDRCLLQEKLDSFYNSFDIFNSGDYEFRLSLPERSVFPGVVTSDQHPVFLDFSRVTSFERSLRDNPDSCIPASRMEVTMTIPLLSRTPTGPPMYSLGIGVLYERGYEEFPRGDALSPFIPVDEITMDENGVVVRNGSDEIRATFIKYDNPCTPPPKVVQSEIAEFVEGDLLVGVPEPDISVCNRHRSLNKGFCDFVDGIGEDFYLNSANICETWNDMGHKICKTSVKVTNMTSGFRGLLSLRNDGPLNVFASETYVGNFSVGLKYPCIQ